MATLKDGLGFEELGELGSQVASLWATGSLTAQSVIQTATNFSGVGSLFAGRVQSTALITGDTNISGVGSIFGGRVLSTALMVSNTNISGVGSVFGGRILDAGLYQPARTALTGSPSTFVQVLIQTSSGVTTAGSTLTVSFPTAFSVAPIVVVGPGSGAMGTTFGIISWSTGSFTIESSAASKNVHWYAVGAP